MRGISTAVFFFIFISCTIVVNNGFTEIRGQKNEEFQNKYEEEFKQKLGDRYEILMNFTIQELQFALKHKIRTQLRGAEIVSDERQSQFLGTISNRFVGDSIFNEYGSYGSSYSQASIWNQFGQYGSSFSPLSPFNPFTFNPPYIFKDDDVVGRLTVNTTILAGINPYVIKHLFIH